MHGQLWLVCVFIIILAKVGIKSCRECVHITQLELCLHKQAKIVADALCGVDIIVVMGSQQFLS